MDRRYTHILWDFNGTVYDDVEACRQSTNQLLRDRGLPEMASADVYREVFDFPVSAYYERVGFDFSREPFAVVAPQWVTEYEKRSRDCTLYPDVLETMRRFRSQGYWQEILSASESAMLERQLRMLGLDKELDGWNGLDTIHATSKESIAVAWRKAHPEARVLLIGDTTHDAQVAAAMGADCILFDGGHMSHERLLVCGVPIIHSMRELWDLL